MSIVEDKLLDLSLPSSVLPLYRTETGALRVSGSRVSLESVIYAFRRGDSPQDVVESFPTLELNNVKTILVYYEQFRAEFDHYMAESEKNAQEIRAWCEAQYDATELKSRLLAKRDELTQRQRP